MKVRVALSLVLILGLLLAAALPAYAGKGGNGKDKDKDKNPPAHSQGKPEKEKAKPEKDKAPQGSNNGKKNQAVSDDPAIEPTSVPTDTEPITTTATITLCHKPGTPAEKTLVLPAAAGPGHLRHGDYVGECLDIAPTPVPTDTEPITDTVTATVTLCHKPGTPAEKTLVLPASAEAGHMGHGDELGECPDDAPVADSANPKLGTQKR